MTVCQGRKGSWSANGPSPHESDGYLHAAVPKQTARPSSGTGVEDGPGKKADGRLQVSLKGEGCHQPGLNSESWPICIHSSSFLPLRTH